MGYYVYIHTCPNGKKYVGCTTQARPELRWKKGNGYQYNKHFYSAILKYGWDNIEHEVFEVDSKEEMYRKEVELISFYHSNDPEYGYNHSSGGEKGALGCIMSEEVRKHMSEIQKKVHADPEYRKRISETSKGRIHTEETKRRMSETAKERWSDPEVRRKRTEANKKSHSDPEVRRKISKALKGKETSEETRRKISKTLTGRHHPRIKIKLPDGTIRELTKNAIVRHYINKGKKFEYVD